jgi:hypothetical protein
MIIVPIDLYGTGIMGIYCVEIELKLISVDCMIVEKLWKTIIFWGKCVRILINADPYN